MRFKKNCSVLVILDSTDNGVFKLRIGHNYYHQIQGQLHVIGARCCDLIVWTTSDCQVIRIARDDLWATNVNKLVEYYFNTFIPSLD